MSRQGWAEARVAASLVAVRAAAGWVAAKVVEVTVAMTTVEAGTAVGAVGWAQWWRGRWRRGAEAHMLSPRTMYSPSWTCERRE